MDDGHKDLTGSPSSSVFSQQEGAQKARGSGTFGLPALLSAGAPNTDPELVDSSLNLKSNIRIVLYPRSQHPPSGFPTSPSRPKQLSAGVPASNLLSACTFPRGKHVLSCASPAPSGALGKSDCRPRGNAIFGIPRTKRPTTRVVGTARPRALRAAQDLHFSGGCASCPAWSGYRLPSQALDLLQLWDKREGSTCWGSFGNIDSKTLDSVRKV